MFFWYNGGMGKEIKICVQCEYYYANKNNENLCRMGGRENIFSGSIEHHGCMLMRDFGSYCGQHGKLFEPRQDGNKTGLVPDGTVKVCATCKHCSMIQSTTKHNYRCGQDGIDLITGERKSRSCGHMRGKYGNCEQGGKLYEPNE